MQHSLFPFEPHVHTFEACRIEHFPSFLSSEKADEWYAALRTELEWTQDTIRLFGKEHLIPRLNAWYGDEGTDFGYSGTPLVSKVWTETLQSVRSRLEAEFELSLNSVLANWYRNGLDKMGWHSDDEKQMCPETPIVSLSLGAGRKMQFKSKDSSNVTRLNILLEHGDVIVMHPPTQEKLKHCIPMMKRVSNGRINLTFRKCLLAQQV